MKIIHCADLHLDSSLRSCYSSEKAALRRNEILKTFLNTVDFAIKSQARVVIIAGDFFDRNKVTKKTEEFVFNKISSAKNIDFLYLKGNHDDNIRFNSPIPGNLKILSDGQSYFYDNVEIRGIYSYDDVKSFDKENYNIAVAHAEIAGVNNEYQLNLKSLQNKNIDCLCLGHIHKRTSGKLDDRGVYYYSGNIDGRGFDECGEKGILMLDTNQRTVEFISMSSRLVIEMKVDITGVKSNNELIEIIDKNISEIDKKSILRIVLIGKYSEDLVKDLYFIKNYFSERFFVFELKDKSELLIDYESLKYDISLKGEFIRVVKNSNLSNELCDKVIRAGLMALNNEEPIL